MWLIISLYLSSVIVVIYQSFFKKNKNYKKYREYHNQKFTFVNKNNKNE